MLNSVISSAPSPETGWGVPRSAVQQPRRVSSVGAQFAGYRPEEEVSNDDRSNASRGASEEGKGAVGAAASHG